MCWVSRCCLSCLACPAADGNSQTAEGVAVVEREDVACIESTVRSIVDWSDTMEDHVRVEGPQPSRRDFLLLGVGAFAVMMVPVFGRRRPILARRAIPMMGTVAEAVVVHSDRRYGQAAISAAFQELSWVEHTMSRFRADSDVGRANLAAGSHGVRITPATAHVVRAAVGWAESSEGAFDPCLGKVLELWDVGNRQIPPPRSTFQRLAGRGLFRALDIDTCDGTPAVRFSDEDVALDLGGIAKGYGVDRAVQTLRDWGIHHALVNVGGDLYALGRSADGDPWRVGIRSPSSPNRFVTTLELSDRAVATSGDYMQFFEHGGTRYHHLMDPTTGAPRVGTTRSVTVSADDCLAADAAATAAFGMGERAVTQLPLSRASNARVEWKV